MSSWYHPAGYFRGFEFSWLGKLGQFSGFIFPWYILYMHIKFTNFSTHEIYGNLNPTKITNLIVGSYTMK